MDENFDIQKELKDLSPELARLRERQNQPFTTPENYFEEMPARMQDHVMGRVRKRRTAWIPSRIMQWAPVAAVLLLALGLSLYFLTRPKTDEIAATPPAETPMVAEITEEEVLLEELDEEFLVEALAIAEPVQTSGIKESAPQAGEEVTKEEIEEYILDYFDENMLTEEL